MTAPVARDDPDAELLADDALNLIVNLGFLEAEAGGRVRIHRLIVAAVQQASLEDEPLASFAPLALSYCNQLIGKADNLITGGQILEGRAIIDQEQALWTQFLDWSYEHESGTGGVSLGARTTAALGNYWTLIGAKGRVETIERIRHALAAARRVGDRQVQADVLQAIGDVQQFRDDRGGALSSYQQALALYQAIGDRLGEANVLAAWSRLTIDTDAARSQALLQQALDIRESINAAYDIGADLGNYGIALLQRGRNAEALGYLERARAIFAERGVHELLPQTDSLIAQARAQLAPPPLPDDLEPVRRALEARDGAAFQAALAALPEEERGLLVERLESAGLISRGPDMDQLLRDFEPLLRDIAAVARGDEGPRAEVEAALADLEAKGWMLHAPVERIWAGERERDALIDGLDEQDALLIGRILELIAAPQEER